MQIEKIDVCFNKDGKAYSFATNGHKLQFGQKVIVETVRGLELAIVCSKPELVEEESLNEPLKKVVRKASNKDIEIKQENEKKQVEIKQKTEELVEKHNLYMKIVSCELSFDGTKLVINFTADDRVDFRELVKELASVFKTRIELRQIGNRDEVKVIGGLGPCGRQCCCNLFLNDYEHSTIKMAKVQGLSLNPTKISGLCGRLMCCLAYENEHYSETQKLMPKVNSTVSTPDGKGVVVYNNLLSRRVQVKFTQENGNTEIKEYDISQIKKAETPNRGE